MTVEAETDALREYLKGRVNDGADFFALARAVNRVKFLVDEGELYGEVRKDAKSKT